MAIKLHRCSVSWIKGPHPCWRVESALRDQGIEYQLVTGPGMPWQRDKRTALIAKTGQKYFPAIEFEDGSVWKAESAEMAKKIRAGELGSSAPAQPS